MSGIVKFIPVIILVVLLLILIISNIVIVQQSRAYVIERLGAFRAVWNVGLHLKVPFIERVAKKVSLKEQVADFAPQPVITKDNVTMQIDTVIYFQITDPKLYTYGVEHPMNAIENLTATTLRNIIGDMELDQSLTSIMAAEAEAQAIMQVQKAMADSLKLLNEAAPNDQVVKLKALEAMEKVADGKATKIIIPSELQGLAGLAASAKTVFDTEDPKV